MIRKLRTRLSYANVVATLALVAAVGGGTAWAVEKVRTRNLGYHAVTASKVNYNAITASKVRNGSLTGKDLRDSSILTNDVRNGSLKAEDFAAGQLPRGDKGDKGDPAASIFGTVSSGGTLVNGRGVTGVTPNPGDATYTVSFAQDVSACAVVGMIAVIDGGMVSAATSGSQVTFRTFNTAGTAVQRQFSFSVSC